MTVAEIFTKISNHIIEGLMIHSQLSDYYDFLNLHGYKRVHQYHALVEEKNMYWLNQWYLDKYQVLISNSTIANPSKIPTNWYSHSRQDVDNNTKRNSVKTGFNEWLNWETDTLALYKQCYHDLMDLNEIEAVQEIMWLIKCVDKELKHINREILNLKTTDYSLEYILSCQKHKHDKYKKKIVGIWKFLNCKK